MLVRSRLSTFIVVGCFLALPLFGESTAPVDETSGDLSGRLEVTPWTEAIPFRNAVSRATDELLYRLCLELTGSDSTSAVIVPEWIADNDDLESFDDAGSMLMDSVAFGDGEKSGVPFMISEKGKLRPGDADAVAPFLDGDDTDGAEVEVIDPDAPNTTSKAALFVLVATAILMGLGNGQRLPRRHKILVRSRR
jgi:hypothetical protein